MTKRAKVVHWNSRMGERREQSFEQALELPSLVGNRLLGRILGLVAEAASRQGTLNRHCKLERRR